MPNSSVAENSASGTNVGFTLTAAQGDSDPLTYSLSGTDAGSFSVVSTSGQIQTSAALDFETKSGYSVTLNVRDNKDAAGGTDNVVDDSVPVTINVTNVDEAGTVTVSGTLLGGSDLTAALTDPDGSISSTTWRWRRASSANGTYTVISGANSNPYTLVALDVGQYLSARASYTDGQGSGKTADSDPTGPVGASNSEPLFADDSTTRTLPENSGAGANVGTAVSATDSDGDTLTYSLSGTDGSKFTIVDTSGQIQAKSGQTYNFEGTNSYTVRVRVRDNKDSAGNADTLNDDVITVTINLTNVNEAPVVTGGTTGTNFPENGTAAIAAYTATDVDASDTQTWSVESADDGNLFEIGASSGMLSFKDPPDFENKRDAGADNVYNATMKVTDADGLSATRDVAVTVTDVNETPTITSGPAAFGVFENIPTMVVIATYTATDVDATTGTMSWDLQGNDAGDFAITSNVNGTATLTFAASPDYEDPADTGANNIYQVTVRVRDNGSIRLRDTRTVAVTVDDVNERPRVGGQDGGNFEEIAFDVENRMSLPATDLEFATYTAVDPDNDPVTWSVSGTDADEFMIDTMSGTLRFAAPPNFEAPTDHGSNNIYDIMVEADDGQGEPNSVGTAAVEVRVININETPEITTDTATHTAPSFAEIEHDATTADLTVATYMARDEEGDTISWSLRSDTNNPDMGDFTIDPMSGALSFAQRPNYEMPADADGDNVYNIIVRASDANTARGLEVTVTVNDVNERPRVTGGNMTPSFMEIEYDLPAAEADLVVGAYTGEDDDADDTFVNNTVNWYLGGADASHFTIAKNTTTGDGVLYFNARPNFENPHDTGSNNVFHIIVEASDGSLTGTRAVTVTVTDVNEQPELTGTPETSVTLDEHDDNETYVTMTVADYEARDEEGGVIWSLTGTDSGDFAIDANGAVTFAATPNYEDPEDSDGNNEYSFTVVATDMMSGSSRRTDSVDVTVTVEDVEEAGTLTVNNVNPAVGDLVTFMLEDPDGLIIFTSSLDINWNIEQRVPGGTWLAITTPQLLSNALTHVVNEDDTGKELRAAVTYTDNRGPGKMAVSEGTAAITADPTPNVPPRFSGGTNQEIPEGEANRALSDRVMATDRDGDSLTFALEPGPSSDLFEINPTTGQVTAVQELDFETQTDIFLVLTVTVDDGRDDEGNSVTTGDHKVTSTMTIRVADVEEDGVVTLSDAEPGVGTTVRVTLEDGDGMIGGEMWRWARSENGRTGWTNITGATSSSYTTEQADSDFYLRASVTYTDRRGAGKSGEAITAQPVFGENQRPAFPLTEDGQRTAPENTSAGVNIGAPVTAIDPEADSLVYALTGVDAAAFGIVESTGQIRTMEPLDFETKSTYTFTIGVHDGLDGSGNPSTTVDNSQSVTITIENVEEPGTVTLTTDTATIKARVPVTAELNDDDGPSGVTWRWSRSPNGRTDWVNIAGATSATYEPTLEDAGNYIRATASYTDGEGPNKTANEVSPRVGDPPPVNSAPAFPSTEDGRREVAEDHFGGTRFGDPVEANDFDGDVLTYSLTGTDAGSFEIGQNDGQLRLASNVELDYEGKRSYRFTVRVTDHNDQNDDPDDNAIDDTISVTVTVTNVNEAPVVSGDAAASLRENSDSAVATYTAADPERDTLTWSVIGNDFWISDRGQLYFLTPPSFERRTTYTVTVTAEDDSGLLGSLPVRVTVTDVEEQGTVTLTPPRGWDGTRFRADMEDGDGVIPGRVWEWQRSMNRSSWIPINNTNFSEYVAQPEDVGYYLRATVTYTDGRGSNKDAEGALTVRIGNSTDDKPTTNMAPEFEEDTPERSVVQGTAAGRSVGAPVRATDEDNDDILVYSLQSGQDADKFDIDPATGQLRTKAVLDYDPQGRNTYTVTVEVHDGFNDSYSPNDLVDAMITVTITVAAFTPPIVTPPIVTPPIVDPPIVDPPITGGGGGGGGGFQPAPVAPRFVDGFRTSRPLAVNAQPGDAVGDPVAATHPDGLDITYALSGADASLFTVDAETGQIRLGREVSLALGQSYTVNLTATDSSGMGVLTIVDIEVAEPDTHPYDLNGNGAFEKDEVFKAISDYFAGLIGKQEALEVVSLYFAE